MVKKKQLLFPEAQCDQRYSVYCHRRPENIPEKYQKILGIFLSNSAITKMLGDLFF